MTTTPDQLEAHFPDLITLMPAEFDSHEFILALAHSQQRDYVLALANYADRDKPFMIVHGEIARRLQNYTDRLRKVGEHDSQDIFGQLNSAVVWQKF